MGSQYTAAVAACQPRELPRSKLTQPKYHQSRFGHPNSTSSDTIPFRTERRRASVTQDEQLASGQERIRGYVCEAVCRMHLTLSRRNILASGGEEERERGRIRARADNIFGNGPLPTRSGSIPTLPSSRIAQLIKMEEPRRASLNSTSLKVSQPTHFLGASIRNTSFWIGLFDSRQSFLVRQLLSGRHGVLGQLQE